MRRTPCRTCSACCGIRGWTSCEVGPLDVEAASHVAAPAAASSPLERLAAREVFAAVAALPQDFRDVLAAVDVAGLSYAEAAKSLDLPVGTVMSRLSRGRRHVAEALGA